MPKEPSNERSEREEGYVPAPPDYGTQPVFMEGEDLLPRKESQTKPTIITAIVALVVVFIFTSFISPMVGKKAYEADITRLETDLVAVRATDSGLSDRITAQESQIATSVAKSEAATNSIAGYATATELASLNTLLQNTISTATQTQATATSTKDELMGKINAQAALIQTLQDKVAALETETVTPSSSTSLITAKLIRQSESLTPVITGSANITSWTAAAKLVLTNPTASDIEDVIVTIFVGSQNVPGMTAINLTSSPALSWTRSGWPYGGDVEFRNNWGLTVEANKSKTLYLTIIINGNSPDQYTVYGYGIDVEID